MVSGFALVTFLELTNPQATQVVLITLAEMPFQFAKFS